MDKNTVKKSKFLSLVLRHQPETIGLELDAQGWADIDDLLTKAAGGGLNISRDEFDHIVATSEKKRFAISPCGSRVRANQGHSVEVDLQLQPQTPPDTLYHGTATRFLDAILLEGLKPGSRQQVHLSAAYDTAVAVGQRHGKPVVLKVKALELHHSGESFFQSDNGVWLVSHVPHNYLETMD